MKKRTYTIALLLVVMICTVIHIAAIETNAQQAGDKDEAIRNNINIMEGILNRLLFTKGRHASFESYVSFDKKTRGTFLEGYGILFNVAYGSLAGPEFLFEMVQTDKEKKGGKEQQAIVVLDSERMQSSKDPAQVLQELKDKLITFFADYAGAIKELESDQRITVVVDFNGNAQLNYGLYRDGSASPGMRRLIATARVSDIGAVTSNAMTRNALADKISFIEESEEKNENLDLSILADIFDAALKKHRHWQALSFTGQARSMYFPGFGAVFMTSALFPTSSAIAFTNAMVFEGDVKIEKQSTEGKVDTKSAGELIAELKDDIIDILARYGASLRSVPDNEYVLISVDLSKSFESTTPSKMCIKTKMADIKSYSRDQLSLESFRSRVQIKEY